MFLLVLCNCTSEIYSKRAPYGYNNMCSLGYQSQQKYIFGAWLCAHVLSSLKSALLDVENKISKITKLWNDRRVYCRERVSSIGTRNCYNHLCAKKKTLMRHSLRISGHSKKRKAQFSLQPLMRERFSVEIK